jgi:hypothetical protein
MIETSSNCRSGIQPIRNPQIELQMAAGAENNPHSKRIIFDAIEWRDRLEQLAEERRRAGRRH